MNSSKGSLLLLILNLATHAAFAENTATNPVPRSDKWWVDRHESFVVIARQGKADLLFIGDSITDNWRTRGSNVWTRYYGNRNAVNFGIGSDRTQHVLWRLNHGELNSIKPKVVVLLIGTNNTGQERNSEVIRNSVPEVIEGVTAVVRCLRLKLPASKILLLGIFPRGERDAPQRIEIAKINAALAKLDDGKSIKFLDLGPQFLSLDGNLSKEIMPDLLHPSEKGYQIWAQSMEATLTQLNP